MIYENVEDFDRQSKYDGFSSTDEAHDRQRNFFVRTYNSFSDVYRHLANNYGAQIKHFHIIQHNKDDVKGTHCHLVIVTDSPTSVSAVYKWFGSLTDDKGQYGNTFVEIPKNITYCYQYLVHANNPEKEPYSISNIKHFGNATPCINAIKQVPEFDPVYQAWEDYKNGASPSFMVHKYGKDYLYHITQFDKAKEHTNIIAERNIQFDSLNLSFTKLVDATEELCQILILRRALSDDEFIEYSPDTFYDIIKTIQKIAGITDNQVLNSFDYNNILSNKGDFCNE